MSPACWDSIESLSSVNWWLNIGLATLGVVTAIVALLSVITNNRLDTLQSEENDALKERLALTEKRLAARLLTDDQQHRFLQVLTERRAVGAVIIKVVDGDSEASAVAAQLSDLLARAGWSIAGPFVERTSAIPPTGIVVMVDDATRFPSRAIALLDALELVARDVEWLAVGATPSDNVALYVGHMATR